MNKVKFFLSLVLASFSLATVSADSPSEIQKKDDIMIEDQQDNTDTYAIPLDESEIEEDIELDRLEGKKFKVPHYETNKK